jgi:hypothetical protein
MALEAILIKTPHTISFSNNPMPFFFALSPYGDAEKSNDIRLQLRVMLEKNYGSTVFEEIKNQTLLPNTEGAFSFDVRTLVDAYLQYYLPRTGQVEPVKTTGQVKKYKVQWSLLRNGISVGDTEESGELTVIKGGLAYDQWHSDEFFSKKVITDKQSLQFYPKGEKVFLDDAHFFFWLYNMPVGITYTQQVVVHVTHTGGSFDYTFGTTFNGGSTKAVYCLPAGWDQFPTALKTSLPAGEYVKSYWIDVQDTFSGDTLFKSGVYTIDYRNYYNSSTIIFRNSLGGLKTIRLRGQIDFEADYLQQQAQRVVPHPIIKILPCCHKCCR